MRKGFVVSYSNMLYKKIQSELNEFIESQKKEKPETIIEIAYELVMKEEFATLFETEGFLNEAEAKMLCQLEYPLDYLYQAWVQNDYLYTDLFEKTVRDEVHLLALKT